MVACGELRLNRIALERCLQALPNIPPPTQACARPCSSDKGRKDNNKETRDFRHRSASTASPSPATRICETASVRESSLLGKHLPQDAPRCRVDVAGPALPRGAAKHAVA